MPYLSSVKACFLNGVKVALVLEVLKPHDSGYTEWRTLLNPLSANPSKWSNTLKQFVGCCRRIG